MEKPEWFEIIDALGGDQESRTPEDSRASRLAKRIAAIGAAAFIFVGGLAFVQSTGSAPSSEALPATSATSTPTAAATNTPVPAPVSTARPAISGGAALGDD